ncbi:MAG: Pseudouridine synthase (modular protein) [Nitrospira sp.]|nr:MAG: Pseudouridine synthase (modular protein) [Nitrospira sp.]
MTIVRLDRHRSSKIAVIIPSESHDMQPSPQLLFPHPAVYCQAMFRKPPGKRRETPAAIRPQLPADHDRAKRVTLDRLLSKLGIASRSQAQEWIRAGRVRINQRLVRQPDTWVAWPGDAVTLDEQPLQQGAPRFILFHKPKGLITTHADEQGRRTIFDVLPQEFVRLHAVGRLDQATSGLLLLTNDTAFSSLLTDPKQRVPRRYLVTVRGEMTDATAQAAIEGLEDQGERLHCTALIIQKRSGRESHLDVTLTEGKNREIRRLFKALGHEVTRLRRIQYGPFALGELEPGAWREIPVNAAKALLDKGLP